MTDQLKPQFFLIRQNGNMVPVIPMDELPDFICLRGVGRSLSPAELTGMTCIGEVESRHRIYLVENLNQSPYTPLRAPGDAAESEDKCSDVSGAEAKSENNSSCASSSEGVTVNLDALRPTSPAMNTTPAALASSETIVRPSKGNTESTESEIPLPGKKVYCAFWMRRGECDYAQQGCAYKHEMPTDPKILEVCGYRDIPNWYREKYGVGSLKATPGSGAALGGNGMAARSQRTQVDWRSPCNKPQSSAASTSTGRHRRGRGAPSATSGQTRPSRLTEDEMGRASAENTNKSKPRARTLQPQSPTPSTNSTPTIRAKIDNLLQLESCDLGSREKKGTSLLDSKYAPLEPERSSSSTTSVSPSRHASTITELTADRRACPRPRAPSTASAITDIEAEVAREISARRAAEDRHYAAIVREQAAKDREVAVNKAREDLDRKVESGSSATKEVPKGPRAGINGQGGRNMGRGSRASGASGANGRGSGRGKGGYSVKRRNAISN